MDNTDLNKKDDLKNDSASGDKDVIAKLEQAQKENEELRNKMEELDNNWKRALADYRNFQKRIEEEKQSYIDFATSSLLLKMLVTLDNLELLNKHINDEGLKMIIKELRRVFTDEGLKETGAEGKAFDPSSMEAVETVKGEENKVVEVIQRGYYLKNKLIRPARVRVGNGQTEP